MKTVHKYHLNIGETVIHLPLAAIPVHVGEQFGELQMWVELNPAEAQVDRHFRVFGTGHPIDGCEHMLITYVGTAIMQGGSFVLHVYEGAAQEDKAG